VLPARPLSPAPPTPLSVSSLDVAAGNAGGVDHVQKAAIVGRGAGAQAAGVVGVGAGTQGAGVAAINPAGPQLQVNVLKKAEFRFPPESGKWEVGAIINWEGALFQCVDSDGAANSNTLWRGVSGLPNASLHLLPAPQRVYASAKDATTNFAKIHNGETRKISVATTPGGGISDIPPWATAVLGTIQIVATEGNGYIAIGAGDVTPAGFSTTVWAAANVTSVTSFTSALADPNTPGALGTLSVLCAAAASAKTHFFVDIVGYYEEDLWFGGPAIPAALKQKQNKALTKQSRALYGQRLKAAIKG
jgi:hypothetical protein